MAWPENANRHITVGCNCRTIIMARCHKTGARCFLPWEKDKRIWGVLERSENKSILVFKICLKAIVGGFGSEYWIFHAFQIETFTMIFGRFGVGYLNKCQGKIYRNIVRMENTLKATGTHP